MNADNILNEDVQCLGCGYNLRGLDTAGRCPECNTPVNSSNTPNLLRYANPDWLGQVKFGFDLVIIAVLGGLVAGFIVGFIFGFLAPGLLPVVMIVFGLATYGVQIWGVYLITAPEPRASITEEANSARNLTRLLILLGLGANGLNWVSQLLGLGAFFVVMGMMISSVIGIGLYYYGFSYAAQLAERIPDPKLVKNSSTMKWCLIVLTALTVIATIFASIFLGFTPGATPPVPAGGGAGVGMGAVGVSCFIGALGFALFVAGIVMLFQYRRAMTQALEQARQVAAGQPVTNE